MNQAEQSRSPAEEFLSLATRLLWVLYLVFWLSIGAYVIIVFVGAAYVAPSSVEGLAEVARLPAAWGTGEIILVALGIACLLAVHRLGALLLTPARLWGGARDLKEFVARQEARRKPAAGGSAVSHAVQQLLGRIVMAHLLIWFLAEVPAIIGLIDRFLGNDHGLFLVMILISALALTVRRPSRDSLAEILAPITVALPSSVKQSRSQQIAQAGAGAAERHNPPILILVDPPTDD